MAGPSVARRAIKSFAGNDPVNVDLGQSWKLFDNNNLDKTVMLYNGIVSSSGSSRNVTAERMNWIELDDGPYQLKTEEDFLEAERRTGMAVSQLLDIVKNYPVIKKGAEDVCNQG